MVVNTVHIGNTSTAHVESVDARWAMNYAASIGIDDWRYYDTEDPSMPVHPLMLSRAEWEATKNVSDTMSISDDERSRGVAYSTSVEMLRPLRIGSELSTTAEVVGIESHRAGVIVTKEIVTQDDEGVVSRNFAKSMFRGVSISGPESPAPQLEDKVGGSQQETYTDSRTLSFPRRLAHVYSECARAWNPIHTDIVAAKKAGLPDLILHGSATLGIALQSLANTFVDGDVSSIKGFQGRFSAMVILPSDALLKYGQRVDEGDGSSRVEFEVHTAEGKRAVASGVVRFA